MIKTYELLRVVAIIQTVGDRGGWGWVVIFSNAMVCCPAVVYDEDAPKVVVGIAPPSEDDHAV